MEEKSFKQTRAEGVPMTHDPAQRFAKMPPSPVERDLVEKRCDYLKEAVLTGSAVSFHWAEAHCLEDDQTYRVNGHHSSVMLDRLNGSMPDGLWAHIDYYEVATKAALAFLFRQFDPMVSARKPADISGAYQGLHDDLATVPKASAKKAIEGVAWFFGRIVGDDVPRGDDRYELFGQTKLHPFVLMVGRIFSATKTPEFTGPVLGAMYGTWEREPTEAERFWGDVAKQGAGQEDKHPTTALDTWLTAAYECRGRDKPKEREIYRACVLAWNAYRTGRSLERIGKYDAKKGAPDLE